jgi:hypothetical protein
VVAQLDYCPAPSRGGRHYHFWGVYRERRQPISVAASDDVILGVRLKTLAIRGLGLRQPKASPRTAIEIERVYWP